ncbi:MAG: hypothetical protein DRP89_00055 [Candidatus Neomarinimicrobiota bacterium]|nr:MAG: hypothetical protein DRP89_00055 [Candidatus Neomarinimicrobiota bacterium]
MKKQNRLARLMINEDYKYKRVRMRAKVLLVVLILFTLLYAEEPTVEQHNIPYKGEKELDVNIEFGFGRLDLMSGKTNDYILESEMSYLSRRYKPVIKYKKLGGVGKLNLYTKKFEKGSFFGLNKKDRGRSGDIEKSHWELKFNRTLPSAFDIDLGLGKGNLDFTDLRVNDLSLECGMSDVTVEFRRENEEIIRSFSIESGLGSVEADGLGYANIARLDVECGLGSANLRFNGDLQQNIKGEVTVGLGSVEISIPKNVGVEIEAEKSFLSSLNLDNFDEIDEDIYRSENWKEAHRKIYLVIEIGLGSVDIDWID